MIVKHFTLVIFLVSEILSRLTTRKKHCSIKYCSSSGNQFLDDLLDIEDQLSFKVNLVNDNTFLTVLWGRLHNSQTLAV